jgi:hypothetical protein
MPPTAGFALPGNPDIGEIEDFDLDFEFDFGNWELRTTNYELRTTNGGRGPGRARRA